jgi:hypothetical protein
LLIVKRAVLICLLAIGCLPQDRLNSACQWTGDFRGPLNLADLDQRRHLELDAALAEDLGIRYGDGFKGTDGLVVSRQRNRECTRALFDTVAAVHSVSAAQVQSARGARRLIYDVVLVFIPTIVLFCIASRFVLRRIDNSFDDDSMWMKRGSLLLLAPVIAGFGLMGAQQWEWLVEWARLRNAHLSYRAARMPVEHYPLQAWLVALLLLGLVVAHYFTPRVATKKIRGRED